jgi:hypothetical protein
MVMHSLQKLRGDGIARSISYHGVDSTLGTHRCPFFINPFRDVSRRVDLQAVEAATQRAAGQLLSVVSAMAMGAKMILIKSRNRKAKLDHVVTLADPGKNQGTIEPFAGTLISSAPAAKIFCGKLRQSLPLVRYLGLLRYCRINRLCVSKSIQLSVPHARVFGPGK